MRAQTNNQASHQCLCRLITSQKTLSWSQSFMPTTSTGAGRSENVGSVEMNMQRPSLGGAVLEVVTDLPRSRKENTWDSPQNVNWGTEAREQGRELLGTVQQAPSVTSQRPGEALYKLLQLGPGRCPRKFWFGLTFSSKNHARTTKQVFETVAVLKILLFMSRKKCVRFPPCSGRAWDAPEMHESRLVRYAWDLAGLWWVWLTSTLAYQRVSAYILLHWISTTVN